MVSPPNADPESRAQLESRIARASATKQFEAAATEAIQGYGPEILGYLTAVSRDSAEAEEVFAVFCEDLWRGIAGFRGDSSMRTWAYVLARNALARERRDPHQRAGRRVPLSQASAVQRLTARVRETTPAHLRTEVKSEIAALRKELDPEDQTLFILRISREMSWSDIAKIMCGASSPSDEELARVAARLRKSFERAKKVLAEKARARGIS